MNAHEWELVKEEFLPIIKRASYQAYRNQMYKELYYDADDLIQIALIKLEECYEKYSDKPMDEFKSLTYVSIKRELWNNCKSDTHVFPLEESHSNKAVTLSVNAEDFEINDKIQKLVSMLKRETAKLVLKELLNPSEKTINIAKADIEEKQKQADAGKNVRVPRTLDIKQKYIRESLGLTPKQFDKAIKEVRDKAMVVFEVEQNFLH